MTTNSQSTPTEIVGTEQPKIKRKIPHRYVRANLKTAQQIIGQKTSADEESWCISEENAYGIIQYIGKCCELNFFLSNKAYLPATEKKTNELRQYSLKSSVSEIILENQKSTGEILATMEEMQCPILCVTDTIVRNACELVEAMVIKDLTEEYFDFLPDNEQRSLKTNAEFEKICSRLKIPRRTRTIMNKSSNRNIQVKDTSNDSLIE